jgi:hypothetical protein
MVTFAHLEYEQGPLSGPSDAFYLTNLDYGHSDPLVTSFDYASQSGLYGSLI